MCVDFEVTTGPLALRAGEDESCPVCRRALLAAVPAAASFSEPCPVCARPLELERVALATLAPRTRPALQRAA